MSSWHPLTSCRQEHAAMSDVSQILERLKRGDAAAHAELLPLVYDELRQMARAKLNHEPAAHSLQATALVHEAWMRLVGPTRESRDWENRGHFFAAAAESMRRILVDSARRRVQVKRGGDRARQEIDLDEVMAPELREDLLELDNALNKLAAIEPQAVALVQLRYFAGLPMSDVAIALKIPPRSADRLWAYARVWLREEMQYRD